jgi:hypothetical protein
MKTLLLGISFASIVFATNIALADGWPTSVLGTWSVTGNHTSGKLIITSQGSGQCQPISGTILSDPMHGFYCPQSGRIHFLRTPVNIGATQDYTGNLSQASVGLPLLIGGTFASDGPGGGSLGEYNWNASK